MNLPFINSQNISTSSVTLHTSECKACWKCIESCPGNVFGKIDLPWHKHVIIRKNNNCIGCKQCLVTCENGALTEIESHEFEVIKSFQKLIRNFNVNILLIVSALISALSGFIIQISYHMGNHGNLNLYEKAFGLDYFRWSNIHKFSIVTLSILMIVHLYLHWNWYKNIFNKNFISKNRQVLTLTAVFLIVALTGFISWVFDVIANDRVTRKNFIEIHDKIALIFLIYLTLHIAKRFKWYVNTYERIKNFNLHNETKQRIQKNTAEL